MGTIAKITAGGATHLIASTCYATCGTAAATAAKVATVQDSQAFTLHTGVTVHVKFTYANGVANPTLNVNSTGAKPIMRYGTTAVSTSAATSWRAGAVVSFTYDGTNWLENTGVDDNSNTYDRTYFSQAIGVAGQAIVAGNLICANFDGVYNHLKSGAAFRADMPILYASSNVNANANLSGAYMTLPFTITTTQSISLIAHKPVWIKGQAYTNMDRTMFAPVSTTPITQDVPEWWDGYQYIKLGIAYSTTGVYLLPEHPIYAFERGYWGPWTPGNPVGMVAYTIGGLNVTIASNSNATIFDMNDSTGDMSAYIPDGAVLVGATFNWATGNILRSINCQVIGGKLHLRLNNPYSSAITVTDVALQLFYK